ncbi:MAG: arylsulfatase A-like enzyme [Halioglobus sp.]|jgi:arylsulfatase A-like enzyme
MRTIRVKSDLKKIAVLFLIVTLSTCTQVIAATTKSVGEAQQERRPNILLIVADDLGYSDLGSYGGEIQTPNLDKLASDGGITLTNFHAAPTCSPTRSMIMSGTYNHMAGLGAMAEWTADNQRNQPGYEGFLNDRVVALPRLLRDSGYYTFMAGKWHLGMDPSQGPHMRGFDDSFAMLPGAGNHYSDKGLFPDLPLVPYRENGQLVKLPENFYSTTFYTDKTIAYIDKSLKDADRPFFGYVAYTAPHWPLQVPSRYSDKYIGKYTGGYDSVKRDRLAAMVKAGIVDAKTKAYEGSQCNLGWNDLPEDERKRQARLMEIYAGMVDALDENIGRVISHLKSVGEYENTLIVFMSDNGADARPERGQGSEAEFLEKNYSNSLENMGEESSFVSYGGAWAEVGSVPFRLHKGMTTEGGIRVPAIIHLPGEEREAVIRKGFASVMDILPTFLDIAGAVHSDGNYKGRAVLPVSGKSMLPYLKGEVSALHENDLYGFSVHRRQGLQFNQWKIVRLPKPHGDYTWELYDMDADPGETSNLAGKMPGLTKEMVKRWEEFASETGIVVSEPSSRAPQECRSAAA